MIYKITLITAAVLTVSSWTSDMAVPGMAGSNYDSRSESVSIVEPPVVPLNDMFDQSVERWIAQLAKEPEFAEWSKAKWRREPLGPGQHGWIVLLTVNGIESGYLVVSVDPSGSFILSEYGSGEFPLFGTNTLYQSLVRQDLIPSSYTYERFANDSGILRKPFYFSPFHIVWSVTIEGDDYWMDGKTGDLLPLDSTAIERMNAFPDAPPSGIQGADSAAADVQLTDSLTLPAFDAYYDLSWLHKPPLGIKDLHGLQALLDQNLNLTCVTQPFGESILLAFPVTGYHEWSSGGPFIRLDHYGPRYVHAQAIMQEVTFYTVKSEPQMPSPSNS